MTNFTLVCSAVADLTAVIVWRYNGEKSPPNADTTTNRTHSILKIKRLTSRNSGVYNCSASNRYGRDSTAVNLKVQGASMHVVCVCVHYVPLHLQGIAKWLSRTSFGSQLTFELRAHYRLYVACIVSVTAKVGSVQS